MTPKLREQARVMLVAGALMAAIAGCEIGSPDEVVREVGINIAGFYANGNGRLVSQNSGAPIVNMNLIQNGDQLQGIDNNGRVFRGRVIASSPSSATITLEGRTSSGVSGVIQATVDVSGNLATMRGTWIEATLYGTVYGQATVPTNQGGGGGNLAISPAGTITVARNSTTTFTASGGTGSYSWSVANPSLGSINGSGSSVIYQAGNIAGTQTVRVASGGQTRSTTVVQQ
ncbi:MAG: hypothetical protein N2652_11285 [Kiritimatiellae bacterium]|nr:hypothetical protein [Kiritimatiellia bacterium]